MRAASFEAPPASLAGMRRKFVAVSLGVAGFVERLYGDHPTHPRP